jgi:hypothetical protein
MSRLNVFIRSCIVVTYVRTRVVDIACIIDLFVYANCELEDWIQIEVGVAGE